MSPATRTESTRSFKRFTQRRSVDFPHPDGPIRAVTFPEATGIEIPNNACFNPYQRSSSRMSRTAVSARTSSWTADGNRSARPSTSKTRPGAGSDRAWPSGSDSDLQSVPRGREADARPGFAPRRIDVSIVFLSDLCVGEAAPQPAADRHRGDVEQDDDPDQEQRRREHHRLRGLAVRALETEVVDVEAEVHEAALGVDERRDAVERELGCELHCADEHQGRDF